MKQLGLYAPCVAGAVLVIAACGGGSEPKTLTPAASVTATHAASPTATATATATPAASSATALRGGEARPLQPGTVVFYETVCAGCAPEVVTHLYRVSVDSSGTTRTDNLLAPLTASGAHASSIAGDWERGDAWGVVCAPGKCDTLANPAGAGNADLYHSKDGGVTWQRVASIDSGTRLIGAFNGHVYTSLAFESGSPVYYQEPEHAVIAPPNWNYTGFTVVQNLGTFWRGTRSDGSLDEWFYSMDPRPYFTVDSARPDSVRWIASTTRGQLVQWRTNPGGGQPGAMRISYVGLDSRTRESWGWAAPGDPLFASVERLDVAGATPDGGRIFGTLVPSGGTAKVNKLVFLDPDSAEVHPIDASSLTVPKADKPVMLYALEGRWKRVEPAGPCAELRWSPEAPSPVYGCAAAGVLLRLLDRPAAVVDGVSWTAVEAPDRTDLWIDQRNLR
ncbi:MAG: hypothetical protein LC118_07750 [Dehalococcoidia bacterium]|nr:hypothetical protein [Dehalococcoidia bacterium]